MIIIDASVAVKWFLPEPLTDAAESLLELDVVRAAPEHVFVEVGQALLRSVRQRDISLDHAKESLAALSLLVQSVPTRRLAERAFVIAVDAGITNYDALYLAAAERWDALLVTADEKLVRALDQTEWSRSVIRLGAPVPFPPAL